MAWVELFNPVVTILSLRRVFVLFGLSHKTVCLHKERRHACELDPPQKAQLGPPAHHVRAPGEELGVVCLGDCSGHINHRAVELRRTVWCEPHKPRPGLAGELVEHVDEGVRLPDILQTLEDAIAPSSDHVVRTC